MALTILPNSGQSLDQTRAAIKENFNVLNTFFTSNIDLPGYQKFPNGLLLKWGLTTIISGDQTIATPSPNYSTMLYATAIINDASSGPIDRMVRIRSRNTGAVNNNFAVNVSTVTTPQVDAGADILWLTIGMAA